MLLYNIKNIITKQSIRNSKKLKTPPQLHLLFFNDVMTAIIRIDIHKS